jgi:transcription termination/antitermination protein NusG
VSASAQIPTLDAIQHSTGQPAVEPQWYAVHTRSQHEKAVASRFESQGIPTFLPLISEVRRWSDRRKVVSLPLFSCYAFVNIPFVPELWAKVMQVNGVLRLVGMSGKGTPIPQDQIEAIRAILASTAQYQLSPFLAVGQRVRIRGGALNGIEGILTARNGSRSIVISVEPIQRSLSVSLDDYQVEPI